MRTSVIKTLLIVTSVLACCYYHATKPIWVIALALFSVAFIIWDIYTEIGINKKNHGTWFIPMPGVKGAFAKIFIVLGAVVLAGTIYTQYNDLNTRADTIKSFENRIEGMGIDLPFDAYGFAPKIAIEVTDRAIGIMELAEECILLTEELRVRIEGLPEEEAKAIINEAVAPYAQAVDESGAYIEQARNRVFGVIGMILLAEVLWAVARWLYRGYPFLSLHLLQEAVKRRKLERQVI